MKHLKFTLPLAALTALAALTLNHRGFSKADALVPPALATVVTKKIAPVEISESLSYPARVVAKINASVLADSDGVVRNLKVHLGEKVRGRTLLMAIDHTDPIYKYAPMQIVAPLSGVVSAVDVSEGSQVTKGQRLASITDPSKVRVVIEVPAEDRGALPAGARADFHFGRDQSETQKIRLEGVAPFVDPVTGTASCEFDVSDNASALYDGMVGRVTIESHQHRAIQVPEFALIYRNQLPFVRLFENGKIRFASVHLGKRQGEKVEILDGLKEGDVVVERASRFVADGEAVQIEVPETSGKS